jgi:hypothetical protein
LAERLSGHGVVLARGVGGGANHRTPGGLEELLNEAESE